MFLVFPDWRANTLPGGCVGGMVTLQKGVVSCKHCIQSDQAEQTIDEKLLNTVKITWGWLKITKLKR